MTLHGSFSSRASASSSRRGSWGPPHGTCLGLWEVLGGVGPEAPHSCWPPSCWKCYSSPICLVFLMSQGPEGIPGLPGFPVSTTVALLPLCSGAVFILFLPRGMPLSFCMTKLWCHLVHVTCPRWLPHGGILSSSETHRLYFQLCHDSFLP